MISPESAKKPYGMHPEAICRSDIVIQPVADHEGVLCGTIRLRQRPSENSRVGFCNPKLGGSRNHMAITPSLNPLRFSSFNVGAASGYGVSSSLCHGVFVKPKKVIAV